MQHQPVHSAVDIVQRHVAVADTPIQTLPGQLANPSGCCGRQVTDQIMLGPPADQCRQGLDQWFIQNPGQVEPAAAPVTPEGVRCGVEPGGDTTEVGIQAPSKGDWGLAPSTNSDSTNTREPSGASRWPTCAPLDVDTTRATRIPARRQVCHQFGLPGNLLAGEALEPIHLQYVPPPASVADRCAASNECWDPSTAARTGCGGAILAPFGVLLLRPHCYRQLPQTTATTQGAWCRTPAATEPSSIPAKPPAPRCPTTSNWASRAACTNSPTTWPRCATARTLTLG